MAWEELTWACWACEWAWREKAAALNPLRRVLNRPLILKQLADWGSESRGEASEAKGSGLIGFPRSHTVRHTSRVL